MRTRCEHHEGLCALNGDEPDRCPACHSTWQVILSCDCDGCGSRERHEAMHASREAARQKDILRRRAARGKPLERAQEAV